MLSDYTGGLLVARGYRAVRYSWLGSRVCAEAKSRLIVVGTKVDSVPS